MQAYPWGLYFVSLCLFLPLLYCSCRLGHHLSTDDFHVPISSSVKIHSPLEGPVETVTCRGSPNLSFRPPRNEFLPFNLMVYVSNTNFVPVTQVQSPWICCKSFCSSHVASSLFLKYAKYSLTSGPLHLCSFLLESAFLRWSAKLAWLLPSGLFKYSSKVLPWLTLLEESPAFLSAFFTGFHFLHSKCNLCHYYLSFPLDYNGNWVQGLCHFCLLFHPLYLV